MQTRIQIDTKRLQTHVTQLWLRLRTWIFLLFDVASARECHFCGRHVMASIHNGNRPCSGNFVASYAQRSINQQSAIKVSSIQTLNA